MWRFSKKKCSKNNKNITKKMKTECIIEEGVWYPIVGDVWRHKDSEELYMRIEGGDIKNKLKELYCEDPETAIFSVDLQTGEIAATDFVELDDVIVMPRDSVSVFPF